MVRPLSGILPSYTVSEYPKCGGSWLGQMLGSALEIPYPRNRFPTSKSNIMHGHYLHPFGMNNVVVLWRDPRDVMVSLYYHSYFETNHENGRMVSIMRRNLPFKDYDDIRANLPQFIKNSYLNPITPRFSYTQFIENWHGRDGVTYSSYEKLRADTPGELQYLSRMLTGKPLARARAEEIAQEYSFERQSNRKPGVEDKNSFLRSGIIGGWVRHFSSEARAVMRDVAQSDLELLGYEPNDGWAN